MGKRSLCKVLCSDIEQHPTLCGSCAASLRRESVGVKVLHTLLAGVIFSMLPGAEHVREAYCGSSGMLTAKDGLCPAWLRHSHAPCWGSLPAAPEAGALL